MPQVRYKYTFEIVTQNLALKHLVGYIKTPVTDVFNEDVFNNFQTSLEKHGIQLRNVRKETILVEEPKDEASANPSDSPQ